MAWSYDTTKLDTTTVLGRTYVVRLLIGDTQEDDPQLQNEEIDFSLNQGNNNVYQSAIYCCRLLASKYSRMVNTQLDGALQAEYSDRARQYITLAIQLGELAKSATGKGMGAFAGGISITAVKLAEAETDRVKPAFRVGQFEGAGNNYIPEYE